MKPKSILTVRQTIQIVLLIVTLLFIFGHSAMPPGMSSSESSFVTRLLEPLLVKILPADANLEHFVRKAAHFTEYFILGLQMFLFVKSRLASSSVMIEKAAKKQRPLSKVSAHFALFISPIICWAVAFIDETIQIFSGRGPAIQDVWLDTAGALTACLILFLISSISSKQQT